VDEARADSRSDRIDWLASELVAGRLTSDVVRVAVDCENGRKESSMESILSNLGAILFLFVAGGTIVAFTGGGILLTLISLNEYLKSIDR
jgi:hypothetical protein